VRLGFERALSVTENKNVIEILVSLNPIWF
jgi:hypothetical protein